MRAGAGSCRRAALIALLARGILRLHFGGTRPATLRTGRGFSGRSLFILFHGLLAAARSGASGTATTARLGLFGSRPGRGCGGFWLGACLRGSSGRSRSYRRGFAFRGFDRAASTLFGGNRQRQTGKSGLCHGLLRAFLCAAGAAILTPVIATLVTPVITTIMAFLTLLPVLTFMARLMPFMAMAVLAVAVF